MTGDSASAGVGIGVRTGLSHPVHPVFLVFSIHSCLLLMRAVGEVNIDGPTCRPRKRVQRSEILCEVRWPVIGGAWRLQSVCVCVTAELEFRRLCCAASQESPVHVEDLSCGV